VKEYRAYSKRYERCGGVVKLHPRESRELSL